jgi:hypothetical protein
MSRFGYIRAEPAHEIERGFFWGCLGFFCAGLVAPDSAGPMASDAWLALVGGGFGALVGFCARYRTP